MREREDAFAQGFVADVLLRVLPRAAFHADVGAAAGGIPIHILKSNTLTQVKEALARVYGPQGQESATSEALGEALEAIRRVKSTLTAHEVAPQNAYVRRLQHQLVTEHDLVARSTGKEPRRRLRIYPSAEMMD